MRKPSPSPEIPPSPVRSEPWAVSGHRPAIALRRRPDQPVRSKPPILPAACLLVALALPAGGPAHGAAQEHPVPQEFDWYVEAGIPEATGWGAPIHREATEQIRMWTTKPEFISPLVDYLPDHPDVTSPFDHFGYSIGRPGRLHRLDELYGYYDALAASSDRVRMQTLGLSEEENEFRLLQIGSPENLERLDGIREGMNALADPRRTTEEEARRWIEELPVLYTVYTGLHSPETAHPEMAVELAYRLAVAEHPMIERFLEDVVVFLVPVAEPDGRNRLVDWYRRHGDGIYHEEDRIPNAPYWGHYVAHDNNRNALQLYLRLTEEMLDLFLEWKHPISLDVHEAGDAAAYHYFSTGTGPYNEYIDPVTIKEWQWMANYESTALERYGMPGVFTHDFYDGWFPGYLFWITNNRNAIGRFTETWGIFGSLPYTRIREPRPQFITREWFRPNPAYESAHWSFRNVINYQQTGVLHSLHWAAVNREEVLEQFWTKSKNSLRRGLEQAPFAWVVPADQDRRADAARLLDLVRKQGIEVHRATEGGRFGEVEVAPGDHVIRMDQPYRDFAHMLMDVQRYPSEGDEVAYIRGGMAWTLPLMHNVTAHPVDDPSVQELPMEAVADAVQPEGTVVAAGNPDRYAFHPRASARSLEARFALADAPLEVAMEPIRAGGTELPSGAWILSSEDLPGGDVQAWADRFGYTVAGVSEAELEGVDLRRMDLPRLALLHTWRETRDSGAVRFALDHVEIPYTLVAETELAGRDLRADFDVILFPEQGRNTTGRQIFEGVDDRHGPLAYTTTEEFPSHGIPNAASDITGGMSYEGLGALRHFVEGGGTLITLGSASRLPVEYSLSRRVQLFEPSQLIIPGSIVMGIVEDDSNPLTFGYDREIPLWHKFGPYLELADPTGAVDAPIRYVADSDDLFMSGVVVAPDELAGRPAVVQHPLGSGRVVLFAFNPMHRYQPHGNFGLVWNAIIHWDGL